MDSAAPDSIAAKTPSEISSLLSQRERPPSTTKPSTTAAQGLPIDYAAVVLGFVVEGGRSRWLSNDEISDGVFAAIESGAALSIVGTLEPWSAHP